MDDKLTEKVIGAAFQVHNKLGWESVYEKALAIELSKATVIDQAVIMVAFVFDGVEKAR